MSQDKNGHDRRHRPSRSCHVRLSMRQMREGQEHVDEKVETDKRWSVITPKQENNNLLRWSK